MANYNVPDKTTGSSWTATEHNLMKEILNGKYDEDFFTIVSMITGNGSVKEVLNTAGLKALLDQFPDYSYQINQLILDINELNNQLGGKVDTVPGFGLSEKNFTADEKIKLEGLERSKDKGYYLSYSDLIAELPGGESSATWNPNNEGGFSAIAMNGSEKVRYIWDTKTQQWVGSAEDWPDTVVYDRVIDFGNKILGNIDGINRTFTASEDFHFEESYGAVLAVFLDGLRQTEGNNADYTILDTNKVVFNKDIKVDSVLLFDYYKEK